jgi:hypothetical protein
MNMSDERLQDPAMVIIPAWALSLTATMGEIKAKTDAIPQIQREIEGLRATMVPISEHELLTRRVDTLWDAHNLTQGQQRARERSEALWRWGVSLAYGVLALWVAAHSGGMHITL